MFDSMAPMDPCNEVLPKLLPASVDPLLPSVARNVTHVDVLEPDRAVDATVNDSPPVPIVLTTLPADISPAALLAPV